ncbi:MAG: preprotein translocase subunit SecE [Patescibacteria group bacterium]
MKIIDYLREVRGEIHHVNFPTRGQTATITALVIAISVVTAYFLGAFDFLFTKALDLFIV